MLRDYHALIFGASFFCSYNTSMEKTIFSKHGQIISQALVKIRNNAGLTQRDLAKKLGRAHSFVAHCELGERRVDLAEFYWICKACETSPAGEAYTLMKAFEQIREKGK